MTRMYDVIIAGGGAAGLFAAYNAAASGARVLIAEKNAACGKKLDITGKGRCNVTNNCTRDEFLENVVSNPRFLYSALARCTPADVMEFFESAGVPLKTERGRRVFPQSDRAHDITSALVDACKGAGVDIIRAAVRGVAVSDGEVRGAQLASGRDIAAPAVIIACGGSSYPRTGSDGSGVRIARELGQEVTPLAPSLVPLVSDTPLCRECMGLSLRNVGVRFVSAAGKTLYSDMGELMFTHFGVTGPVVLSASAYLHGNYPCELIIDMKPALDEKTLDKRLLRDFSAAANRELKNSLSALLPAKLIAPFVAACGVPGERRVNSLTREERARLVAALKSVRVRITGTRPLEEAIVTHGGVSVRGLDAKTMGSRITRGLYFAGEVIDVDAYTGGYNLQIAFSTGCLAGVSAAEYSLAARV